MIVDWAVSLFVVTFIVFGLVIVTEVEFATVEHTYASATETGSVARLVADKVDRMEGLSGASTENFTYSGNSNQNPGAVVLPLGLNSQTYYLDFTHDYVIAVLTSGSSVGTAVDFWQPVYLFNSTTVNYLSTTPVNGTALQQMSDTPSGICQALVSGDDFEVVHLLVLVDGQQEYITVISSENGVDCGS